MGLGHATLSKVFLLSPAHCGGRRATALVRPATESPLAGRLRAGTLTLGELFSHVSSLYFRGKIAYARAVTARDGPRTTSLVITPTRGLCPPDEVVSIALLEEFASTDIGAGNPRFREPLERDVDALAVRLVPGAQVVLLGSIASDKYVEVLAPVLGERLYYPSSFVGRGDMSRGGLLLRSAESGVELDYVRLDASASRRGQRPPRLAPRPRQGAPA
jgi:hypothetical protein